MRTCKLLAIVAAFATCSASLAMAPLGKRVAPVKSRVRPKRVLHVVAFKFKQEATKEQINRVCRDFKNLQNKIPQILSYHAGVNISPEKLNKGFTHCFIVAFRDTRARDSYLVHPAHKEFAKSLGGLVADVFVIDFETQ